MGSYFVTEKMTEIVQILAEHYDYAVSEDNTAMSAVHERKRRRSENTMLPVKDWTRK